MIYVFTGDGKGKTSAALGTAVRAVGAGMSVAWVAFYKQESWGLSDAVVGKKLEGLEMYFLGKGFHIEEESAAHLTSSGQEIKTARVGNDGVVVDTASKDEHVAAAEAALGKAKELVGTVDVLVLDEVNNAVDDGLIPVKELLQVLHARQETHIILTGRNAHAKIIAVADLVTEMKKVKHPYDKGTLAIKGLDF